MSDSKILQIIIILIFHVQSDSHFVVQLLVFASQKWFLMVFAGDQLGINMLKSLAKFWAVMSVSELQKKIWTLSFLSDMLSTFLLVSCKRPRAIQLLRTVHSTLSFTISIILLLCYFQGMALAKSKAHIEFIRHQRVAFFFYVVSCSGDELLVCVEILYIHTQTFWFGSRGGSVVPTENSSEHYL